MSSGYLTVQGKGCDEIIIQKSRFIGYAAPCETEDEALSFIEEIRKKHKEAKHHCYAYIIGKNLGIMRFSDDGEPGGTAGMPMMDILKKESIVNCCVVVVRYFGGVLLGTGGLVRAYTQSCKIALASAHIVRMELTCVKRCKVSYALWNQIQYRIQKMPVLLKDIVYSDMVEFLLCMKIKDVDATIQLLNDSSDGKISWSDAAEKYMVWDD